ncbi:hypothetical protein G6514_009448 [Epicoccum nigrum]|nr:hypothetical protein G6514_009448 [Epicoccum nigrum]
MPPLIAVMAASLISSIIVAAFTILAMDNASPGPSLHPVMPKVYEITSCLLNLCLDRFLDCMEESYNFLWWASFPALIASIICVIPVTKWEALGIAVSIPLQVVLHIIQDRFAFRRETEDTTLALRNQLQGFENGTVLSAKVKDHFVTKEDAEAQADAYQETITHGKDQLKEATWTIGHLQKLNNEVQDDLEDVRNSQTYAEQCRRDKEYKAEISRW